MHIEDIFCKISILAWLVEGHIKVAVDSNDSSIEGRVNPACVHFKVMETIGPSHRGSGTIQVDFFEDVTTTTIILSRKKILSLSVVGSSTVYSPT